MLPSHSGSSDGYTKLSSHRSQPNECPKQQDLLCVLAGGPETLKQYMIQKTLDLWMF